MSPHNWVTNFQPGIRTSSAACFGAIHMAIVTCPVCEHSPVSTSAESCPSCGATVRSEIEIGKCPECRGTVSNWHERCPHCGFADFYSFEEIPDGSCMCRSCNGQGRTRAGNGESWTQPCYFCNESGRVPVHRVRTIDKRTAKQTLSQRRTVHGWEIRDWRSY